MNGEDKLCRDLGACIENMLKESLKTAYSLEERGGFNIEAGALRDRLVKLEKRRFDAATQGYAESTIKLKTVNAQLKVDQERIDNLVKFFADVAKLAAALDTLIQAAASLPI